MDSQHHSPDPVGAPDQHEHHHLQAHHPRGHTRAHRLTAAARVLHVIALAAYLTAVFVPVLASTGQKPPMRFLYTALGDVDKPMSDNQFYLVLCACVLVCTVSAVVAPRLRVGAAASMAVGAALLVFWENMAANPPILMWDGVDGKGMPIGGMERGDPTIGMLLVVATALFFIVGGVCGLAARRRALT